MLFGSKLTNQHVTSLFIGVVIDWLEWDLKVLIYFLFNYLFFIYYVFGLVYLQKIITLLFFNFRMKNVIVFLK